MPVRQLAVSSVLHVSQADAPRLFAYVPVRQAVWAVEPLQKKPAGAHGSQTRSTVVLQVEVSYSPGAQTVHGVGLDPEQKEYLSHSAHRRLAEVEQGVVS